MDLLKNQWIGVVGASGNGFISPSEISGEVYWDIRAPRPDFRGALYQFLIGFLQTAYAPEDRQEWRDRWDEPPTAEELEAAFAPYQQAFLLENPDGPAFMQDLQLPEEVNQLAVLDLLIDAGSDSNLFFNKPSEHQGFCEGCFAQALLTLQLNAPPGGRGTRTSVRGGGPLTTLLIPAHTPSSLWQKLWLNVLPSEFLAYSEVKNPGDVLPWLVPTRTSDTGGVGDTTPETVHPLQAYWSMPRRIRLDASTVTQGSCAVCGTTSGHLVQHYRTRYGGTNYTGAWKHPLTPYSIDKKGEKPPLSSKGQPGGIAYNHWLGLTLGTADRQPEAAKVVRHYSSWPESERMRHPARLWCFGFDMDNMKARCWYDSTLPIHNLPKDLQDDFARCVAALLNVATDTASLLHKYVKAAWFERPTDVGSEPAIRQSFWQATEADFYRQLEQLSALPVDKEAACAPVYRYWLGKTRQQALALFDDWVMAAPIEEMSLQRVVEARADLIKDLAKNKHIKALWNIVNLHLKERIPRNEKATPSE